MKKYYPAFFLVFIVPQIVLATWWNPFSWAIFRNESKSVPVFEGLTPAYIPVSDRKTAKQPINNTEERAQVDLSSLNSYVDNVRWFYEQNLEYINGAIKNIDVYDASFQRSRDFTEAYRDDATKGFEDAWKFVLDQWDDALKIPAQYKSLFKNHATRTEEFIAALDQINYVGYVTPEQYMVEYEKLKATYADSIGTDRDFLKKQYEQFKSEADNRGDEIGSYMLTVAQKEMEYSTASRYDYKPVQSSYKPVSVPQIQMPKTTYCTMTGGLGGFYSIVCN